MIKILYHYLDKKERPLKYRRDYDLEKGEIKKELNKPIMIVSHLITRKTGSRYDLSILIERICKTHNILFINPVEELKNRQVDISTIFEEDCYSASHYNKLGHSLIGEIYNEYITKI